MQSRAEFKNSGHPIANIYDVTAAETCHIFPDFLNRKQVLFSSLAIKLVYIIARILLSKVKYMIISLSIKIKEVIQKQIIVQELLIS